MKADQATLAQAEGQLRAQLASLHQERAKLANEVAKHESATVIAHENQQRHLQQLQEARETISDLEKKLALAMKPTAIPKPRGEVNTLMLHFYFSLIFCVFLM
jgi:chorismate mutase